MVDTLNNTSPTNSGLLLVGHGTRDPHGLDEARLLADKVQAICPDVVVELCFLEFAAPDIGVGVERLVRSGVRKIRVMPLMLLAAGHVKQDIPVAVEAAAEALGDVEIDVGPPLGCHEQVVRLSEQRYREAVAGGENVADGTNAKETLLVLVARGNRDTEAQDEWLEFVEMRRQSSAGLTIEAAYLAMAEPLLDEVLAAATSSRHRRIVVQPHLLFAGKLLVRLRSQVASLARAHPQQQWLLAQHLGPSRLLADAVAQIAGNRQWHNRQASQRADVTAAATRP